MQYYVCVICKGITYIHVAMYKLVDITNYIIVYVASYYINTRHV